MSFYSVKFQNICRALKNAYTKWWRTIRTNFTGHRVHMIFWCKHERLIIGHIVHMIFNSELTDLSIYIIWLVECYFPEFDVYIDGNSHNDMVILIDTSIFFRIMYNLTMIKSFTFDLEGYLMYSNTQKYSTYIYRVCMVFIYTSKNYQWTKDTRRWITFYETYIDRHDKIKTVFCLMNN